MTRRITTPILAAAVAMLVTPSIFAQADTGSADFTEFVALGDSLVAGEVSNTLVETYQENSIPALIFKQVTGESDASLFQQPLYSEGGDLGRLALIPPTLFPPVRLPAGIAINADPSRPFDNLGMSGGARVNDLLTISGEASCLAHPLAMNKDCARLNQTLQDRGTALDQTLEQNPTFVFLWVGGNDALQAATGATVIEGVTLTPAADFENDYRALTDAITASGADILLANVVSVNAISFVSFFPPVVIDPNTFEPVLVMGQTVPLFDAAGPLAPTDRPTLLAATFLEGGCGIPDIIDGGFDAGLCPDGALPDDVVLKETEAAQIDARIEEYNAVIRAVAEETGSSLFDAHGLFNDISDNGLTLGGIEYTLDFLTGGLIGFDGVHAAPLLYAHAANLAIGAINRTHGSRIPLIDLLPFVAGPQGSLAPPLPPLPSEIVLSGAESLESIRSALGVPTHEELQRLIREHQASPGPTVQPRPRRKFDRSFR